MSNAPWTNSGYGSQAGMLATRLAKAGHSVTITAMTGLSGQPTDWHGIRILPVGYAAYGNDVIGPHARRQFGGGPGLVIALYDAWVFDPQAFAGLAAAMWSPVHSRPMSLGDRMFYAATGAQPIAMSRYGERQMKAAGLQPVYIPHGVDTDTFSPLDDEDRAAARELLGVPADAFLVSMVAANKGTSPPRKSWGEALTAFARFRKRHPEAVLFLHTLLDGGGFGIGLQSIVDDLGIGDAVRVSDQYSLMTGLFTPSYVAGLMGCSDVFLNPSSGEGFGIPAVEAQACGTPVIVGDNSAQTELCGAGWLVKCQQYWVHEDRAWWHVPEIGSVLGALEKAHTFARRPVMRAKAREFALRYDVDTVFDMYWMPALAMLEQYAGAVPVSLAADGVTQVPLPTAESDGLRWIQRGAHTDDWIATGHEEALAPVLTGLLPDDGVFLDVGAHVGRWALRLSRKASKVIAVEASPDTAAVLRAHIAMNKITNVRVAELAAWDKADRLSLEDANQQVTGGSTRVLEGADGTVEAAPLDWALADEDRIDLVKLDVEGADLHALRGMENLLERCQPVLFIERHDIYGYYQLDELTGLLEELGYSWRHHVAVLQGGAQAPYIIAEPARADQD